MNVYEEIKKFKKKYPQTIAFRLKHHAKVLEEHINPDEKIFYMFAGQKGNSVISFVSTNIVIFTNQRMIVVHDRFFSPYFYTSITPDMLNDFEVKRGYFWGHVCIDTVKEVIYISNIDPNALVEIEDNLSKYMIKFRPKFLKK